MAWLAACLAAVKAQGDDWTISGSNTTVSSGTKVGIGLTVPNHTLDVNGSAWISSTLGIGGALTVNDRLYLTSAVGSLADTDTKPAIYGTSDYQGGANPFNLNGHLVLQARSGGTTGRDILFYSGTTPAIRYRLDPSGNHAFSSPVRFNSTVGIAGAAAPDVALYINPATSITSGAASQRGILSQIIFPSSATNLAASGEFRLGTAASSFTMAWGIGLRVASPSLGSGSAVTTLYGLKVENQSGGGDNYAIHTGAGKVRLGDAVTVASTLDVTGLMTASGGVQIDGGSGGDGRMWKSGLSGLALRGVPGNTYSFGLESNGGNILLVNPLNTSRVDILGNDGLRVVKNLSVTGGTGSEILYGTNFRFIDYRSITLPVGTEAWVKLATVSNNSNVDFLFRNGSNNSEEVAELKVFGTYYVGRTGVQLTRQTYNRHLKEVRVTGTDGGAKAVYVLVRISSHAPTISWAANVTRGSITAIHNVEETPTGGLSVPVDNSANTVREVVGNLDYSLNSMKIATNLAVNGTATITGELHTGTVVATNWRIEQAPDYVFEKGYDLAPLEEVESFVRKNKHLPEVPSAREMKQKGLDLVKMNFDLLKKVEELTLHAIRQEKILKRQESALQQQEATLRKQLRDMESQAEEIRQLKTQVNFP